MRVNKRQIVIIVSFQLKIKDKTDNAVTVTRKKATDLMIKEPVSPESPVATLGFILDKLFVLTTNMAV